ncbi:box C/D snoRNA protein 1 isoform X2 [Hypanus sabinus]|uniref:box C/D snoRNA protein 1 isoform X2 n=1 Tax=Hypanus sabinus TaxID=79690 RepID=UPI0028C4A836|nr:box C/D snoRNA protein 1 isoform X2 [Hypanus sabinus]
MEGGEPAELGGPTRSAGGSITAPIPSAEPGATPAGRRSSPEPRTRLDGAAARALPLPGPRTGSAAAEMSASAEEQQSRPGKNKLSLAGCEICGTAEAKYKCPRCMTFSCSLLCVKKHKTESGCSGVRDKTAFQSIADFTETQLLSDYRFLEDAGRLADSAHRDTFVNRPTSTRALNFMKNRARKCGVNLRLLPIGFTKRRENSTFYHKKDQMFYWHVKLVFPQSCATYTEKRVADSKTLEELLSRFIDPLESDPVIRQKLKTYVLASPDQVCIFLKVEGRKCSSVRYHRLESSQTLAENLRQKTVIEYPTLYVVLKANSSNYRLLNDGNSDEGSQNSTDSSSEDEMEDGEVR